MKLTDSRGLPVSTSSLAALEKYERAVGQTLGYFGSPLATLDEALSEDADFAAAHALRADLAVMSSEQGAHVIDFYRGDSILLRDHLAQALPYWSDEVPGYGYLLGMYAFGLEETANYARAEDVGRHALSLNPRDPWAVHAVQHVFETQGRIHDGIEWLNATSPNWSDTALAFHNWWHLALHQLDLGDIPAALGIYDRLAHPQESTIVLELVDASQLLARIQLRSGAVGTRWAELADCCRRANAARPAAVRTRGTCAPLSTQHSPPATAASRGRSPPSAPGKSPTRLARRASTPNCDAAHSFAAARRRECRPLPGALKSRIQYQTKWR